MDWLEEKAEHLKSKIRNLHFRSTITVYILMIAAAAAILSFITVTVSGRAQVLLWNQYNGAGQMWTDGTWVIDSRSGFQKYAEFTQRGRLLMNLLDIVRVWSPFIYGVAGSIAACMLFYKNRLLKPLEILMRGTDEVRRNNLDFDLTYDSGDEMGKLCSSFDEMRQELISNKETMWKMIENQKQLNAAFAHDLRTPLTVLKGYSDFLARYIPEGKVSEEKMLDTLKLMSTHLSRLEQYSRTMKGIRSLDEIPVKKELCTIQEIGNEIGEIIFSLNQIGDIKIHLRIQEEEIENEKIYVDNNIFLEVLENLISNAIRFSQKKIEVMLSLERTGRMLGLAVHDDGPGFSESARTNALRPYYRQADGNERDGKEENPHFGIGLHICRQLCEKHGGNISIADSIEKGAIVTASFDCKND